MSARAQRIWRVRGAYRDSSLKKFRWRTNRTSFYTYWTVNDGKRENSLMEFVLTESSGG